MAPADILFAALKDPHDPKFCGTYLLGCLDTVFPRQGGNTPTRNHLSSNFEVWDTLARFISTKRTSKQMTRLLKRLCTCTCKITDPNIQKLHDIGDGRSNILLERNKNLLKYMEIELGQKDHNDALTIEMGSVFPVEIFQLLASALDHSGVKRTAKGSSRTWPTSPSDLIPLGADTFVESMVQWYTTLQDGVVFSMIGAALRLCRAVILPKLTARAVCGHLVQCMRTTFDCIWRVWTDPSKTVPERVDVQKGFLTQMESVQPLLDVLTDLEMDAQAVFVRGNETKLCQLCNLFLSVRTDPRFTLLPNQIVEKQHFPYAFWSHKLYRLFHMHLGRFMNPPRPNMPLHTIAVKLDELGFPPPASVRDPPTAAMLAIIQFKADFRCCGKDCASSLQSEGKAFQKCSGCGTVGYCGKPCQIQDWKNNPYPHKTVCPLLRKLIATAGGINLFTKEDSPRGGMQMKIIMAWMQAGVKESDLTFVDEWAKDREKRWDVLPNGEPWEPGYQDYEQLIWNFQGPKPRYPNSLARWPSEVAKVKALLEQLPFFDQAIDYHTPKVSKKMQMVGLD